jgi:hypothetical protein
MGASEGRQRKKGAEEILSEIALSASDLMKNVYPHNQDLKTSS